MLRNENKSFVFTLNRQQRNENLFGVHLLFPLRLTGNNLVEEIIVGNVFIFPVDKAEHLIHTSD